jgi:hypothetical protein
MVVKGQGRQRSPAPREGRWRHLAAAHIPHGSDSTEPVLDQLLLRRAPRFHVRSGAGDLLAAQVDGCDRPTEGLVTAPGTQVDLQLHKIRQLD